MTYIEDKREEELVDDIGKNNQDLLFLQAELTRRLILSIRNLDKTTSWYSKVIIALTVVLGILAAVQVWFTVKQTNYAEVQSRKIRIFEAQQIQYAIDDCEQSPQRKESNLYDPLNGEPYPCSEVLRLYKK